MRQLPVSLCRHDIVSVSYCHSCPRHGTVCVWKNYMCRIVDMCMYIHAFVQIHCITTPGLGASTPTPLLHLLNPDACHAAATCSLLHRNTKLTWPPCGCSSSARVYVLGESAKPPTPPPEPFTFGSAGIEEADEEALRHSISEPPMTAPPISAQVEMSASEGLRLQRLIGTMRLRQCCKCCAVSPELCMSCRWAIVVWSLHA